MSFQLSVFLYIITVAVVTAAAMFLVFYTTSSMHRSLEAQWQQHQATQHGNWIAIDHNIQSAVSVLSLKFTGALLTFDQLMEIERKVVCDEIWIVTGSLEGDIKDSSFEIIKANTKRNIRYKYIIPDTKRLRDRAHILESKLDAESKVEFEYMQPEPLLEIINIHDFVIYDPHGRTSRQVYMNIPMQEGKHYFFQVGPRDAETVCTYLGKA